jgi:hypothetical protein
MNFIGDILRIKEKMFGTMNGHHGFFSHRLTRNYLCTMRSLDDGKGFSEFMINKNKASVLILPKPYQRFY